MSRILSSARSSGKPSRAPRSPIRADCLARSAATSIASDAYGVIPLFVLMGLFVSATAMGRDTFDVAALVLKRLRGGLAMATVGANAVFAACTGTSIASASIFTKIAVPEMVRHGHTTEFSVGVVAGSSVLGMLIPPSILFIIFGVIANVSIGDLFTSGILPGIVLSIASCITRSMSDNLYGFSADFGLNSLRCNSTRLSGICICSE